MTDLAVTAQAEAVLAALDSVVLGKRQATTAALAALLSGGHLLIEDIPGVGKTTLAKALARLMGLDFKRIQFTPDLLPSDVTGTSIYSQKTGEFSFRPGPVFANVVLGDEINRATPKSQSALLEAMEERQVTVDGVTHRLPEPFFVIATQNNIELAGTYPLPAAQLDRFTATVSLGYPSREDEALVLRGERSHRALDGLAAMWSPEQVVDLQAEVRSVYVSPAAEKYILDLVAATRAHSAVTLGASPRGALHLQRVSQAYAAIRGRDRVYNDDTKAAAVAVLGHRLVIKPEHRMRGLSAPDCVRDILQRTPVSPE